MESRPSKLVGFLIGLGVLCFVGNFAFYLADFPTVPDSAVGRIYPLNNHGHITYLTDAQMLVRSTLFISAIVCAALAAVAYSYSARLQSK
jgi:hypothetical protein